MTRQRTEFSRKSRPKIQNGRRSSPSASVVLSQNQIAAVCCRLRSKKPAWHYRSNPEEIKAIILSGNLAAPSVHSAGMPRLQDSLGSAAAERLPGVHLLEAFPVAARCRFPSRLSSPRLQRAHSGQVPARTYYIMLRASRRYASFRTEAGGIFRQQPPESALAVHGHHASGFAQVSSP